MVRELADYGGDGVRLSSIALLQERFRQLEKMKEMRQEKELLRMLNESDRYSPPMMHYYEPPRSKTLLGSELIFLPPKPHCQLSLSLMPNSQIRQEGSPGINQYPSNRAKSISSVCAMPVNKLGTFDHSDVDTSLHL